MGGFVLRRRSAVGGGTCHERPRTPPSPTGSCVHTSRPEYILEIEEVQNTHLHFDLPIAVNSAQLCMLVSRRRIEFTPISKEEIKDKSKEDGIVKLLAVFHVLWLLLQLIDRRATRIPSTQLEITVLGFAASTFITYLLWLEKPKDVTVATEVLVTGDLTVDDKHELLGLNCFGFFENAFWAEDIQSPGLTVPNDMTYYDSRMRPPGSSGWIMNFMDAGFLLGAVVLGACHCIAWNFDFPTHIEQTLWRATSAFTTAVMPAYYLVWYISCRLELRRFTLALTSVTFALYALCRLYIIVEAFRSLFYLPPAAFIATWSLAIPHIG